MIPLEKIRKKFGEESAFIILVLRIYFKKAEGETLSLFLNQHTLNWKFLNELICAYEIRPLIYKVLYAFPKGVDEEFLFQLRADCLHIAASNFEKLKELLRLHQVFKCSNIRVVPFKGVFLSKLLFGDYTSRETCDIDFLFQAKDSLNITTILLSEGYQTNFYFNEKKEEFILKVSSERSFYKNNSLISGTVEIHWMVTPPAFDVPIGNKTLLENTSIEKVFGNDIEFLSIDYSLITLLVHHGVTDVWRNLKHVVDTAAFLDKYSGKIMWPTFNNKLQNAKIEKTGKTGFMLAHQLFGVPMPPVQYTNCQKSIKPILHTLLTFPMLNRFKYSPKHFLLHLSLRDSATDKIRFLFKCFCLISIPTANDLKWINLPKRLFFMYYFLKPFRLLKDRL